MVSKQDRQQHTFLSSLKKIRSRIFKIIDEKMYHYFQQSKHSEARKNISQDINVTINESKLEEWVQFLMTQVLIQKREEQVLNIKAIGQNQLSSQLSRSIQFPKPHPSQINRNRTICFSQNNKLKIISFKDQQQAYKRQRNNEEQEIQKLNQQTFQFPQNILKKFCSINYIEKANFVIIIGGCKQSNPNIKSSKIYGFDIKLNELKIIGKLPYGLSSHATVYSPYTDQLFIIGGNKNYSVITRGCFKLILRKCQVEQISCMNYPGASMNCILWRQNWIYKFGGIGQSFEHWNTSPYIQRYSISQNQWQVINPTIPRYLTQKIDVLDLFLVGSSSYICQNENQIFIFGGQSIKGQKRKYALILQINEQNLQQQGHKIKQFGMLNCQSSNIQFNKFVFTFNSENTIEMYGLQSSQNKLNQKSHSLVNIKQFLSQKL